MQNLENQLQNILKDHLLIYAVLSNPRNKESQSYKKITLRPIEMKGEKVYQFTYHYEKKVTHENLRTDLMITTLIDLLKVFRQGQIFTNEADYQILISKKYKAKMISKPPTKKMESLSHNRKKKYILEENVPNDFLIRLGVMNDEGKVLAKKYDKFRQINRFLEMVGDVSKYLDKEKLDIVDFGCGKSYLTFALYYYLVEILKKDVNIIGLDLKEDVIKHCNKIAQDLGYKHLTFMTKDIKDYTGKDQVDMVVTLHACDTATDAALIKAIQWKSQVILSVPCCQHELLNQIHNDNMIPLEKHGIIKEKLSSLITDSVRANILEIMGYDTQILEFIDMEHTPKNLLIRGIQKNKQSKKVVKEYETFKAFWGITPYFEKELGQCFVDRVEKIRDSSTKGTKK